MAQPTVERGRAGLAERNQDFQRLLGREKLVTQLSYLDSTGKERVRTSPLELDRIDRGIDRSRSAAFTRARAEQRYLGRVYFQRGSQPHMTIAVSENAPGRGVVVAEIDLSPVRQAVDRARVGTAGYAYAVDSRGELLTHSDIDLVLRHTNFASLPQVRDALRATATAPPTRRRSGAIRTGRKCSARSRRSSRWAGGSSSSSR